jgi:hypothetical protein
VACTFVTTAHLETSVKTCLLGILGTSLMAKIKGTMTWHTALLACTNPCDASLSFACCCGWLLAQV